MGLPAGAIPSVVKVTQEPPWVEREVVRPTGTLKDHHHHHHQQETLKIIIIIIISSSSSSSSSLPSSSSSSPPSTVFDKLLLKDNTLY